MLEVIEDYDYKHFKHLELKLTESIIKKMKYL